MIEPQPFCYSTSMAIDNLDVLDRFVDEEGHLLSIGMRVEILHHNVIAGARGIIVGLDTLNENMVPKGETVIWVRLDKLSSLLAIHPADVRQWHPYLNY